MTFQEQVGRITAEDKFLYASESEIRKLLGDNPLSPAQMEGRLRANLYADVTLSSNRKRTSTLLSMGVKRGDPIELKLSKSGDVECFPIEAYWNDTKMNCDPAIWKTLFTMQKRKRAPFLRQFL